MAKENLSYIFLNITKPGILLLRNTKNSMPSPPKLTVKRNNVTNNDNNKKPKNSFLLISLFCAVVKITSMKRKLTEISFSYQSL